MLFFTITIITIIILWEDQICQEKTVKKDT
jgi:hypothetical protein